VIRWGVMLIACSRDPPGHGSTPDASTPARSASVLMWWAGPWMSTLQPFLDFGSMSSISKAT